MLKASHPTWHIQNPTQEVTLEWASRTVAPFIVDGFAVEGDVQSVGEVCLVRVDFSRSHSPGSQSLACMYSFILKTARLPLFIAPLFLRMSLLPKRARHVWKIPTPKGILFFVESPPACTA